MMLLLGAAAVTGLAAYDKSSMSRTNERQCGSIDTAGNNPKMVVLLYRDISDSETEYCCDRDYPDKACGAADC